MLVNKKIHNYLKAKQKEMLTCLCDWIEIKSGSRSYVGLDLQLQALKQSFSLLPVNIEALKANEVLEIDDSGKEILSQRGDILSITYNERAGKKVLLVGHMDTVFTEEENFSLQRKGNILRGPGASDMKGGLVVIRYALSAFIECANFNNLGCQILINADEEIGSLGSCEILNDSAKKADIGFVYEPALNEQGTFAGSRKGSGKFCIVIKGMAAHSGRDFKSGISAIVALSAWIEKVHHLNYKYKEVTINIGLIKGGTAVNVVPELALARIDIRTSYFEDEAMVAKDIAAINQEIETRYKVSIAWHGDFIRKPKPLTEEQLKLYKFVQEEMHVLGKEMNWQATGGCCDGNNLAACGLPTIDTLGVRGGGIHSANEYMCIDSLLERAELSARLLCKAAKTEALGEEN